MDIIQTLGEAMLALLAWIWSILSFLFSIWFLGPVLQLAFIAAISWIVYRYTPSPLKTFAKRYVLPATGSALTPMRWYLTRLIAKPEWLRQPSDPKPVYVDRIVEVPTPMRRTFGEWLMSGVRWGIFWASVAIGSYLLISNGIP